MSVTVNRSPRHRSLRPKGAGVQPTPENADAVNTPGLPRAVRWGIPLGVGLLAFLAFSPALSAEFVNFDDGKLLQQNQGYQGLSSRHLEWMFTTTYMGHYQPLTWLSYALDYQLAGANPHAYHRTNLILHALNAVLAYFLALRLIRIALRRTDGVRHAGRAADTARRRRPKQGNALRRDPKALTQTKKESPLPSDRASVDGYGPASANGSAGKDALILRVAAAVAALLFAVHPLRVESVAWVSERRDVLSVFFLLAAALAFLRSIAPGEARLRSRWWYAMSLALLSLSLLAKAWGMSFFVIVTLLNIYPLGRLSWRVRDWLDKRYGPVWLQTIPYAALGVLAAAMAARAQSAAYETMKSLEEWSVLDRCVQACYGLAFYLYKTIWPSRLAVLYPIPSEISLWAPRFWISVAAVLAGVLLLWRIRRRWPALVIAGMVYAVCLAPVLGFAQSGPQLVADRYSYVACLGWMIVLGGGLAQWWRRYSTVTMYSLSGVMILAILTVLFAATVRQTSVWKDSKTLWAHAVQVGADSTIAHRNYALDLTDRGDLEGAVRHYRIALSLDPEDGSAWYLLANALKAEGRFAEAEEAFQRAIEHLVQKHLAWQDLGIMYYEDLHRTDDAIRAFRAGIDYMQNLKIMRPAPAPRLYLYLGMALRAQGDFANARPALEAAAKFKSTQRRALDELQLLDGKP